MRPLALDYLNPAPRQRVATYVLAMVALGFALHLGFRYTTLKAELRELELQLATNKASARGRAPLTMPQSVSAEEYAAARDTARHLATPWSQLFRALEAAQTERVALLAISPDPDSRTVNISGEARDYLAALSYVATLSEQKSLRGVRLSRHEVRPGAARSVVFTVSAAWKGEE